MGYDIAKKLGLETHFDADGDNTVQTIKDGPGKLFGLIVQNPNNAAAWIQLFDESGTITVGSTTPKQSYPVPDDSGATVGATILIFDNPINFDNSIKYACTTGATNGTDPGTGLVVNALYK